MVDKLGSHSAVTVLGSIFCIFQKIAKTKRSVQCKVLIFSCARVSCCDRSYFLARSKAKTKRSVQCKVLIFSCARVSCCDRSYFLARSKAPPPPPPPHSVYFREVFLGRSVRYIMNKVLLLVAFSIIICRSIIMYIYF